MKLTILLISLCLPIIGHSQGLAVKADSDELLKLRAAWQAKRVESLKAIDSKYRAELDKLRKELSKQGRVKDAIQVQNELDALKPVGFSFEGKWMFLMASGKPGVRVVSAKHVIDHDGKLCRWSQKGSKIAVSYAGGAAHYFLIDQSSPTILKGIDQAGKPIRWMKVE